MTQRILGSATASATGPTLIGIGGIHGNEPAGVWALEAVLDELQVPGQGLARGRLVALAGNRSALGSGVRYVDRDLNRIWMDDEDLLDVEGRERAELVALLDELRLASAESPFVVDLHTTSGSAPPFAVLGDNPRSRELGLALPVPLVLGLPNEIRGTLLQYLDQDGWVNLGFESGSHLGVDSVALATAALWLLLGATGLVDPGDRRVVEARTRLETASEGFPRAVEVFHHHSLNGEVDFRMLPGFQSFQAVEEGELLATEGPDRVHAPANGRLLMPLYQPTGGEGFFLARAVPFDSAEFASGPCGDTV